MPNGLAGCTVDPGTQRVAAADAVSFLLLFGEAGVAVYFQRPLALHRSVDQLCGPFVQDAHQGVKAPHMDDLRGL